MIRIAAVTTVLLLTATACSSSGGGSNPAPTTTPAANTTTVRIAVSHGELVGPDGHTLYANTADSATHLICTGQCLSIWPPVLGTPAAGRESRPARWARSNGGRRFRPPSTGIRCTSSRRTPSPAMRWATASPTRAARGIRSVRARTRSVRSLRRRRGTCRRPAPRPASAATAATRKPRAAQGLGSGPVDFGGFCGVFAPQSGQVAQLVRATA